MERHLLDHFLCVNAVFTLHVGPCTIKCHKCEKIGHKARYYKEKNVATGVNALPILTCYDCGEQDHTRNRCQKKVKQEETGEVHGQAYAIKDAEPKGPNVVTGEDTSQPPHPPIASTEAPQMVSSVKLPILKKDEACNKIEVPLVTAQQILAKTRERKAKSTLLIAISDENLARFHGIKDAKTLWAAIKTKFDGVSTEDANQNFLRSLPLAWSNISLIMRNKPGIDNLDIDDLYNNLKLDNKDLEKINQDDLEEMDLKWEVAMLSMRVKRFYKKTGRKLEFNGKELVGFDKTKVECFNCYRIGNFARDCKSARNLRNMSRDSRNAGYRGRDNGKRPAKKEDEQALVVQNGLGTYDWIYQVKEEATDFALMDFTSNHSSSSSSNSELDEALKEKEDLKAKLEKFETSSKNLTKLLDSQISAKVKTGLGYDSQFNEKEVLNIQEEEVTKTVFNNRSSDEEDSLANDRFKKGEGYHAVPSPLTGNYMPPKPDLPEPIPDKIDFVKAGESVKHVKPVESVKHNGKMTQKLGLGFGFTKKACFVCGSMSHLIKDCTFHEDRMAKKSVLPTNVGKGTGHRESRPVWNNVQRINHQNKFAPTAVFTRSGRIPISAAKPKAATSTSAAKPVNTVGPKQSVDFLKSRISAVKGNGVTAVNTSVGNKAYLADYQEINDGGFVTFGSSRGKITGKGQTCELNQLTLIDVAYGFIWSNVCHEYKLQEILPSSDRRLEKKRKARTSQHMKRRLFKGRVETSTDKSLDEDATKQERNNDKIDNLNLTDGADKEVIVEDKGSGEKGGSTADQVSTASPKVSVATLSTPPTTTTIFGDEDLTIAQTLINLRNLAQRIYKEELAELDKAQKEKQKQKEATIAALTEEFDEIQAKIDVDHELAVRLTHGEQEKYTIEERARLLAEYFERRKKQLEAERAEAIKNKPPTRTQKIYHKEQKWINDFVPMDSEKEEKKSVESESKDKKGNRIKRVADSALKQKSSKKQKMKQEQESA
uniref:CCHC-type domain-containing protein n=1 Tax=Tanacetum cinerariifolium TaxID=118510 RepID=A0A699HHN3_TANCI|nr:hypothetical protein [Tanacetum cinerariifolium]